MQTVKGCADCLKTFVLIAAVLLSGAVFLSCKEYTGEEKENFVRVKLSDYDMELLNEKPIGPGITVFEVTNEGDKEHSFVIEGLDVMQRLEENLRPGETRTISVELKPSGYNVYCPVGNHRNMGMASVIRITGPGGEDDESGLY
ncbi:MAG: cupredoxin domain-containing protein [Candidatus Dadabacteria bacterium]|jgi:uncharacterized cupredoxin-like copper-binding protein|nr:cupredoxin domain-containing protein [Candidatus Dadabacteria bacterium]